MNTTTSLIAQGIQLSIAPVFMLAAVAAMINAVLGRLARIIDRGRFLEEAIDDGSAKKPDVAREEMRMLRKRARTINLSLAFLALCALLLCITAGALFVTEVQHVQTSFLIPASFLGGLLCFIVAVLFFLAEVWMSTYSFRFGKELFVRTPSQ